MANDASLRSFTVKPEIVLLEDLFEEIKQGQLRSPRFQRAFSWRLEDMRRLLDSVLEGFPIGSLLIWEPGARYECLASFGPIPQGDPGRDRNDLSYVLDGQHRLATLFGVMHVTGETPESSEAKRWWMWYDLLENEFTHGARGDITTHHLPLRMLLRTTDFLRFSSELLKAHPQDGPQLIEKAEKLSRLIRGYRMPVVRIRGGKLEDAIEIFSRLNSSGQPMAPDQIASALTYREGENAFDLASRITEILERLEELRFGGIDRTAVLRTVAGVAGIQVHTKPGEQIARLLGKQFDAAGRERLVEKSTRGLVDATRWLAQQGALCDRLLPYALQLILLANFFCERPPTEAEYNTLRRWLFATSFAGWFAGGNTTLVNTDLAEMGRFVRGEVTTFAALKEHALPFPERFDLRSARVRAFLLSTLLQRKPLLRGGDEVDVVAMLLGEDVASVPRVFPRLAAPGASKPANRILLPTTDGKGARQQLLDLTDDERDDVLASHCIDDMAWKALVCNDAEAFVAARTKHLMGIERAFMQMHGIRPPERESEESPIDTGP